MSKRAIPDDARIMAASALASLDEIHAGLRDGDWDAAEALLDLIDGMVDVGGPVLACYLCDALRVIVQPAAAGDADAADRLFEHLNQCAGLDAEKE